MKKNLVLLTMLLIFSVAKAQNSLGVFYSNNYTQQNIVLNYGVSFGKSKVSVGVKYILNPVNVPNNILRHHFYAEESKENFGLDFQYSFNFFTKSFFSVYAFANVQYTNTKLIGDDMSIIGPAQAIENNLGIGMNFNLLKNLYLEAQAGGGLSRNFFPKTVIGAKWDNAYIMRVGLFYTFGK